MVAPLQDFLEVFKRLSPEKKQKLIHAHQEFTRLRSWCEAKGYIEILPQLVGIKVLKNTKEVRELKKVVDFLQPAKFKWLEIGGSGKKLRKR